MSKSTLDLYELLPAVYRIRDAEQGYPLKAALAIVAEQVKIVKENVDGLWDDVFIETCAEWVVPYIGRLVGNNPLYGVTRGVRADVAKTISYRRRKGTLPMLEELARDVTGWGAHAVAFFELLGWTQHLNHLRYQPAPNPDARDPDAVDRVGTVNLRNLDAVDRVHGPFDRIAHTVDVRPVGRNEGWYNIKKVGFFLWRLRNYPLVGATARQAAAPNAHGYHFSPLGNPTPLFTAPRREADPTGLATELHLPGPIRPLAFFRNPADFYGDEESLAIYRGPAPDPARLVPLDDIVCQDLSAWAEPPSGKVAVDLRLGRLAFRGGESPADGVTVRFNYGFSADIGGGPYDRRRRRPRPDPCEASEADTIADPEAYDTLIRVPSMGITSIGDALGAWDPDVSPRAVIQVEDSRTYPENLTIDTAGTELVIQAANRQRPVVLGNLTVAPGARLTRLVLNGLVIAGDVRIESALEELGLAHCTLVPGGSLAEDGEPADTAAVSLSTPAGSTRPKVEITSSIVGALALPDDLPALIIRDTIVDAFGGRALGAPSTAPGPPHVSSTDPGPPTTLERVTVFGDVQVRELTLATEVIFDGKVVAERQQAGCVRFSYLRRAQDSQTPRRYRCQPDLALEGVDDASEQERVRLRLIPPFTSERYGDPSYAQLGLRCAEEIRTGAEDGSEIGVFSSLHQPQRETNLRIRLEEYLPFGLDAGLIFVT